MKISFEIPDDIIKDAFMSYGWMEEEITPEAISKSIKESIDTEYAEDARHWRKIMEKLQF